MKHVVMLCEQIACVPSLQRPWWTEDFLDNAPCEFAAVVMALSALLHAHARCEEPSHYQQALLLQASAQLTTSSCVQPKVDLCHQGSFTSRRVLVSAHTRTCPSFPG